MSEQAVRRPTPDRSPFWRRRLARWEARAAQPVPLVVEGRLRRMAGLTLEAEGCQAAVGAQCDIVNPDGRRIPSEVVGFAEDRLFLMPIGDIEGVVPDARVIPTGRGSAAGVGKALLGRVIDARGHSLDGKGPLRVEARRPLAGRPLNPMQRRPIREPLDTGVRAINALLTVGRGQRLGLFAGSGVGKSVLLGMMTRYTNADVIVVGLIGERGREVVEFVQANLGEEGLARAVVVAAPADSPPLMRLHGAMLATSIAEYFRDQGLEVLLLMDSLTRFAQAQREIALAVGEPPATKGYPPSVFARLPRLVERAGNGGRDQGGITAFYTVLAEGDDQNDPVADAARAILDGHIVLTRELAEAGHFPAIDLEASISRAMNDITDADHLRAARRFRHLWSLYRKHRDLISVGAYQPGSDPQVDEAITLQPKLAAFLQQDMHTPVTLAESLDDLERLCGEGGQA
ncbi:MAG: flagellar protein export ATPase FliI [Gammaproteobacteria bacterium]|nr:MAG: flagellar protein export ATPase FliI [Gammaproteobacteria bacterium]